jgi:undecaprenyl-diphosphatase
LSRLTPYHLGTLLIAGIALSLLASLQYTVNIDKPLLQSVQQTVPANYEGLAWFYNVFLRHTGIPALWAATIIFLLVQRRNDYAALFVLTAAVGLVTTLLKETVARPRPAGDFAILQFPTDPSFPSGHVMTAVAFFGLWYLLADDVLPRWAHWPVRLACLSTIVLTGLSRIWTGAHWPTDVLGGAVWGSLFLVLVVTTQPLFARLNPLRSGAAASN